MTGEQWLSVFREIGQKMRAGITEFLGREGGTVPLGRGAGGDRTFPVDKWAEDIVIAALEEVRRGGGSFTLVSEELGVKKFGDGRITVLVDPIDGSNNAKNGVPFFSSSLALIEGDKLGDLSVGYVVNLAVGDEYWAVRDGGAFKNGKRIATAPGEELTVIAYEASSPKTDIPRILPLLEAARRTRCFGSTALDLSYLASGALSALAIATPARTFDYAAGMLILREAGGVVTDFSGSPLDAFSANLERTASLLASKNSAAHARALRLLAGA
jgi:myo-inositol-1(or 4)-monophosphatase